MFGWLIVGEASTPLLNARWFLIRQGLGNSAAMRHVSLAFAAVFFLTRFVIYGSGLAHQITIYRRLPTYINRHLTGTVMIFVVIGFALNLVWLSKIARVALAPNKPKARAPVASDVAKKLIEEASAAPGDTPGDTSKVS
jgi:TLC domain